MPALIQLGVLTLMGILLAALALREPLGLAKIIGMAVVVAGLATITCPALLASGGQAFSAAT